MARPFPGPNILMGFSPGPITFLIVLTAVISVFSAVTFLCGSRGGAVKSSRRKKAVIGKMKSGLISKALLTARINSWRKVQDEREAENLGSGKGEEDIDSVVWKKTIIKGEKCKPIDFSGKILYDTDGNLLTD